MSHNMSRIKIDMRKYVIRIFQTKNMKIIYIKEALYKKE